MELTPRSFPKTGPASLLALRAGSSPDARPRAVESQAEGLEACAICLEVPKMRRRLRFGHRYCRECIGAWLRTSPRCPTCRRVAEPLRDLCRTILAVTRRYSADIAFYLLLSVAGFWVGAYVEVSTHGLEPWDAIIHTLIVLLASFLALGAFVAFSVHFEHVRCREVGLSARHSNLEPETTPIFLTPEEDISSGERHRCGGAHGIVSRAMPSFSL